MPVGKDLYLAVDTLDRAVGRSVIAVKQTDETCQPQTGIRK
ncbi:MAG: hypothetical protein NTX61_01240 [Bacteroidetes bacterium]|nr:hypothetical protein [Bacteroidota bacterium]